MTCAATHDRLAKTGQVLQQACEKAAKERALTEYGVTVEQAGQLDQLISPQNISQEAVLARIKAERQVAELEARKQQSMLHNCLRRVYAHRMLLQEEITRLRPQQVHYSSHLKPLLSYQTLLICRTPCMQPRKPLLKAQQVLPALTRRCVKCFWQLQSVGPENHTNRTTWSRRKWPRRLTTSCLTLT